MRGVYLGCCTCTCIVCSGRLCGLGEASTSTDPLISYSPPGSTGAAVQKAFRRTQSPSSINELRAWVSSAGSSKQDFPSSPQPSKCNLNCPTAQASKWNFDSLLDGATAVLAV